MAKLKYTSNINDTREVKEIEFTFSDDLSLDEFRIVIIRMLHSMGYHPNSIEKCFGSTIKNNQNIEDFYIKIR
jgi:hypothetical protein